MAAEITGPLAVYGDVDSLVTAAASARVLADEAESVAATRERAARELLADWHGQAADAHLSAQQDRARGVAAWASAMRATAYALEILADALQDAREGVGRVLAEAAELGLRVRDDAQAVYVPPGYDAGRPGALSAPEDAARLTGDLRAIAWRAQAAWELARQRLSAVQAVPLAPGAGVAHRLNDFLARHAQQLVTAAAARWLWPHHEIRRLEARYRPRHAGDPETGVGRDIEAEIEEWKRRLKLPPAAKALGADLKDIVPALKKVPLVRGVGVLSAASTAYSIKREIDEGTDPGVAVGANTVATIATVALGVTLAGLEAPFLASFALGFGVGWVVHWALETEPVQRAVKGVESAVSSGFRRLARSERAAMDALARAG